MMVFVTAVFVCSVCAAVGWAAGRQVGRWAAPPANGYVAEVFRFEGMVAWHSFDDRAERDEFAACWSKPGFVVLVADPPDKFGTPTRKRVVYGADVLEEWESVWAIDG